MHRSYKLIVPRFNLESTVKYADGITGFGVLPQNHVRGSEDGGSGCPPLPPPHASAGVHGKRLAAELEPDTCDMPRRLRQPLSKRMYGVGVESVRLFAAMRHDLGKEPAIARRVEQCTMPADRSLLSDQDPHREVVTRFDVGVKDSLSFHRSVEAWSLT